jgi:glucose-1-phosphate adenylyltransferase
MARTRVFRRPQIAGASVAVVLAGGNGTRLGDLTRHQCKPALPFGGHFRNIDFTLSNCVNSQVRRIGVLTQYKPETLIGHLGKGWNFLSREAGEFIDQWPAQQRSSGAGYAGTADAVYQNLDLILGQGAKYTLVLAGDHVYKMDYRPMLERHAMSGASVTVACVPVPLEQASAFGVIEVDSSKAIGNFMEKPAPSTLIARDGKVLASMGIYAFDTDYLASRLERDARARDSAHDFGRDILPAAVREDRAAAFAFLDDAGNPGYWRDVGTLEGYWQAHMELLGETPSMDLHDPDWPIWTAAQPVAPAQLISAGSQSGGFVANSMLSGGTVIRGAEVTNSVLGTDVHVGRDSVLDESVILSGARIGANCFLRRAIIDCDVRVPDGTIVDGRMQSETTVALVTRERIAKCASRTDHPRPGLRQIRMARRHRSKPDWADMQETVELSTAIR